MAQNKVIASLGKHLEAEGCCSDGLPPFPYRQATLERESGEDDAKSADSDGSRTTTKQNNSSDGRQNKNCSLNEMKSEK